VKDDSLKPMTHLKVSRKSHSCK